MVLCSDGVWSVVEDEEFGKVASEPHSVNVISRNLINLALHNETDDNASVVVFHLRKLIPASTELKPHQEGGMNWFQNLRKLVS